MSETVPAEVERLLTDGRTVAHLATCHDGKPHAAPLWFRYAGDDVVEIMTTGRKLENVRQNPRVALSVQRDADGHPEWMVTLRGTATVVADAAANREANRRINRKYGADDPDDWVEENTLVRIDVASVAWQTF